MNAQKIAIMYSRVDDDAPADEKDVLVQVGVVRSALRGLGYEALDVPISLDLGVTAAVLKSAAPLLVFNLAETIEGKGRLIHLAPSLLDALGIPYTGAPSDALYLTSHKLLAKRMLAAARIQTPPWCSARAALDGGLSFKPPYILKSIWEHASIGLEDASVARVREDLIAEIRRRGSREGLDNMFVESFVEGREFNLALLAGTGPENLPPSEIEFVGYPAGKPRVVGYKAKWEESSFEYSHTPPRFDFDRKDAPLLEKMAAVSRTCWSLFGLRGYARVDMRVDARGRPWVLEVNANPCLSLDAGFMAAAARVGLTMEEVVRRIIADTLP